MFIKNLLKKIEINNLTSTYKNEDYPVLNFLSEFKGRKIKFLETGFGTGRFLEVIKDNFNFEILGIEINSDLVSKVKDKGFSVVQGNILSMPFSDSTFDVVHCSHVIEHFKYPEVVQVIDELMRVVKINGFVILRSPLINPDFYIDIDHVRPYPPESILHYFNNPQQQKVGKYRIEEVKRWYRRENFKLKNWNESIIVRLINLLSGICWRIFGFPFGGRTGYVMILKKVNYE